MMFLDCPAYLNHEGAERCGLPAEVRCRFIMQSSDGPLECAMIRCPAGHYFNGSIESLTWEGRSAPRDARTKPEVSRPNTAPAYYLGHPARLWITVMRRRHTTSAGAEPAGWQAACRDEVFVKLEAFSLEEPPRPRP